MGPMNSAFMHCSQKTGQQLRLKEKKKRENADAARLSAIQTYTINFIIITKSIQSVYPTYVGSLKQYI